MRTPPFHDVSHRIGILESCYFTIKKYFGGICLPKILVRKSAPLEGTVKIDGAKNAALPIIAASLLGTEPIVLEDVPNLVDVKIILKVLESLGAKVEFLS